MAALVGQTNRRPAWPSAGGAFFVALDLGPGRSGRDNPLAAATTPWHDPGMRESDTTPATSKTHYSIAEAARLKGVHPNTVRKYIRQGRIKAETIQGPYGVEYAIPEAELDSLGVPVLDTAQGLTLTESGSLTWHLDTLTLVFQSALTELQTSHEQAIAAKDETIALLTTRVQDLEREIRLLNAPAAESAKIADLPNDPVPTPTPRHLAPEQTGPVRGAECPPRRPWWRFWARD